MGITPKALQNRPVLDQRWHFANTVFNALTGSRRYTAGGPANIPISEYDVYARGYGFTAMEWRDTWEDLQVIDSIWLTEVAKKMAASKPGT